MEKNSIIAVVVSTLFVPCSYAASKWSNCTAGPQAEAIQEAFWKSDVAGGSGPTYELESGHTLSSAGAICTEIKIDNIKKWNEELKAGINPAKSVTSFKAVKTASELHEFLSGFQVSVNDPEKLSEAVTAFLSGKPLNYNNRGSAPKFLNPAIIVGASKKQAVIVLASSDGLNQSAVLLQLDRK